MKKKYCIRKLYYFQIIFHLICVIIITSAIFFPGVLAEQQQFNSDHLNETITIPQNYYKEINLNFQKGKKLEIVFLLQTKEDLPIDIWFVNEDNYLLLSNGAQFLYFKDGTEQQVTYAKKIVTLTEHDNYKLVLTNYYANQSVEVDIAGEIRTYGIESNEKSSEDSLETSLFYPFLIILISLVILTIFLSVKIRRNGRESPNNSKKSKTKKSKNKKKNKSKQKAKDEALQKRTKNKKSKQPKPEITITTSTKKSKNSASESSFCGHCGQNMSTPYCTKCGEQAQSAVVSIKN